MCRKAGRTIYRKSKMENQITIESQDGTFHAYISRPTMLPAPAVVVLQELFGVNADIRATCDDLAKHGYIAIAQPVDQLHAGKRVAHAEAKRLPLL
jgi:dienelactone hydrolase